MDPTEDQEEPPIPMNEDGSATFDVAEDSDVVEQPDGSAVVTLHDEDGAVSESFEENLAEVFEEDVLSSLATELIDDVERDKEARSKRDKDYAEGIKRTGLGNEAPGGADFDGASRAVHPALVEGCIDFAARAIKELFPAEGPVKTKIIGEQTEAKVQKAERKRQFMNWQLTSNSSRAIKEYRRELEVALTQLPLGGSQYLKFWYDERWKRPRVEFVPIDNFVLPFEATDTYTAHRKTHIQQINRATFDMRVASGAYREIEGLGDSSSPPEQTESAKAAAKVDGADDLSYNEDGLRMVYESQVLLTLEEDPLVDQPLMPYLLTVDVSTRQVLALRRNWDEKDETGQPVDWVVELPFIPWRGAYAIGLAHIIGGLSGAATGALRALLDSALINTVPSALKLKGARMSGQNTRIEPLELSEIEGPTGIDDIRKIAMPMPFNPPSAVLFELLQWLTAQAKGVVATAEEKIADAGNNMPVGTALALIEQGSVTFSSIHARLHDAQKRALAILHRLNGQFLSDKETVEELGELVVSRADFEGPMDIEPVSDPNIFSDAQRYAQIQAVQQLSQQAPQLYNVGKLHQRALRLLKIPNPEELLSIPGDPKRLEAAAENAAAFQPQNALKAYSDQDHLAHMKSHIPFMTSPMFGASPMIGPAVLPKLLAHCAEHIVYLYSQHAKASTSAGDAISTMLGKPSEDTEVIAEQEVAKLLAPLMPGLQKASELAQQFAPKPPQDSVIAAAQMQSQSKDKELQLKSQQLQQSGQIEQAKLAQDAQAQQGQQQLDQLVEMLRAQSDKQALQLEGWQTQVEMLTSQNNAGIAAQEGQRDREFKLFVEQMQGQQEERLAAINGRIDLVLEAFKQHGVAQAQAAEAINGSAQSGESNGE